MRFILYTSVVYILHKSCVQNVYKISVWVHQDFQGNLKSLKSKSYKINVKEKSFHYTTIYNGNDPCFSMIINHNSVKSYNLVKQKVLESLRSLFVQNNFEYDFSCDPWRPVFVHEGLFWSKNSKIWQKFVYFGI